MKKQTNYKKIIILQTIIILITLSIAPVITTATAKENTNNTTITIKQTFSEPTIQENEDYLTISIKEAESQIIKPGEPKLPTYTKTIELPMGTKIKNIECTTSEIKTMYLTKQIEPTLNIQTISNTKTITAVEPNQNIYTSNNQYPTNWYNIEKGAGINKNNQHALYLFLQINPVLYIPASDKIQYINSIQIIINCCPPEPPAQKTCVYDLLIISPQNYAENLTKLVEHKNNMGIKTIQMNLSTIYETTIGRDQSEKIKYYIKNAYENWGIKYVLLVGDVQKLPIRIVYSNWFEPDSLSDLYYADFYNADYEFCSWDANNNSIFGELEYGPERRWPPDITDIDGVDLCADVHIGRVPCTNSEEVDIMVNKIITYETKTYDSVWFKKIILAGGDTFPPAKMSAFFHYEGEITNTQVAQQLPDFEHIKLWASKRNLNAYTFNKAINDGAGFVSYAGHGFEHGWGTYKPNALIGKMGLFRNPMYFTPFVKLLKNQNRLPIIFFDACLTAKLDFNITDLIDYFPIKTKLVILLTRVENDPTILFTCFAYSFLKHENGGAIATIGATRSAYSIVNKDGVQAGAGLLDVQFFKSYGQKDITILGEMLTQAQNGYIERLGKDYFTLEEYILLGDPSLKVGGYP